MSIITLTTDYGNKDYFVSSLKAKIVSEIDTAEIIDISHNISPFNLTEAGYILEGAHKNFPNGTIHMICVDSELTPENKHIVIKHEESFFIGADNGVFSLIFKDIIPENIFEINLHNSFNYKISSDDLFIKVLGHILRSGPLNVVGTKINKIKEIKNLRPVVNQEQNQIIGSVIYIDNYGNVITNIKKKLFLDVRKNRNYTIKAGNIKINKINDSYSSIVDFSKPKNLRNEDGKKIAIFNKANHLELSIYKSNPLTIGSASTLFGLYFRDPVSIIFE